LKVIFHINEFEKWETLLGNITNLLKDGGDEAVKVRVLMNGPSVKALSDETLLQRMRELSDKGVRFTVCRNSLKALCGSGELCIDEKNLPEFLTVVPAGVTELIKRQTEGYAYIKP
jgi:hypothetical protein